MTYKLISQAMKILILQLTCQGMVEDHQSKLHWKLHEQCEGKELRLAVISKIDDRGSLHGPILLLVAFLMLLAQLLLLPMRDSVWNKMASSQWRGPERQALVDAAIGKGVSELCQKTMRLLVYVAETFAERPKLSLSSHFFGLFSFP